MDFCRNSCGNALWKWAIMCVGVCPHGTSIYRYRIEQATIGNGGNFWLKLGQRRTLTDVQYWGAIRGPAKVGGLDVVPFAAV